ncbi:hypothetical protein LTS14_004395 [Recurvomyces mirabilis]|uniref:uncharacterized protein n=1 Tax=Recurvomyces mirabilis TaxID=574656 RepID=UPI002DE031E5|nr:hypothetical protein LTS14_004395 [Recurvomyces mirabilis]
MRGNDDQEPFLPSVEEVLLPRHSTLATTAYFAWNLIATASILLSIILTANILSSPKTPTQRTEEIKIPDLPLKQLRFSGSLKYHDDGSLYLDRPSKGPEYVGNTTAVSHAWEMFESAQTVKLDPSEVDGEGLYRDENGNIITILDSFHQLHCLNQIREALYNNGIQESSDLQSYKRRLHIEHCVDYIRQAIQCTADVTPLKLYYSEPAQRMGMAAPYI